jgi:hypothetical protein
MKRITYMKYPDLARIRTVSRMQLAIWARFLPSPGSAWIASGPAKFDRMLGYEVVILEAILDRFKELGGWSPSLSKKVTWDEPGDEYDTVVILDNLRKDA